MAKRMREEEELDEAIARSLSEAAAPNDDIDRAIAASLDEEHSVPVQAFNTWDCCVCTRTNFCSSGRCESCGHDRRTPYAAKESTLMAREEWRCGLPGCVQPRVHFDFCCADHRERAARRGLLPPRHEGEDRVFCGASGDFTCALLTNKSTDRADVVNQFKLTWRKSNCVPRVERVYAVRPRADLVERNQRYAAAVGNSRRRFHGTSSVCNFAIDDQVAPCASGSCALCSILAGGFSLAHAGSGPNATQVTFGSAVGLRYGRGLYFSSTSGKSNDYAAGSERKRRGRRWRTLFLCNVAAGHAFCTDAAEIDLSRAPNGYDSVVGEVGGGLNFDELVVYSEAAALPEYLIVISFDD